ncbi:MAG: hypothetical protein JWO05_1019 [Gemmatimonadetes bacterium]|nr:hypothetical protein [Gemmatimonadota bacterium]
MRLGVVRKPGTAGKLDGLHLLGAYCCGLAALAFASVAVVRGLRERDRLAASRPVAVVIESCVVVAQKTGGRDAVTSHELRCDVSREGGAPVKATVTAGYIGSATPYDEWVSEHQRGSTLELRQSLASDSAIWGLERLVPATTTSAHARRRALQVAVVGLVLLALSRVAASSVRAQLAQPAES